ncbi:MAG: pyrimidine reductase family protein [Acidimicrobiales bacterium]|nr:MAG: pyrimidine reductase family protein [Acidimicrobiales bacterium]
MTDALRQLWPLSQGDSELSAGRLAQLYDIPRLPWLRANFACSVDGAAAIGGRSEPLSGSADKQIFRLLRDQCDAIIVGAETFRLERYRQLRVSDERQAARVARGLAPHARLVVISSSLDLDFSGSSYAGPSPRPRVITHRTSDPARRAALTKHADVECIGETSVDLPGMLVRLHQLGLRRLLCEGGPRLFGELAAEGLVDELCLTVSPQLSLADAPRITAGVDAGIPRTLQLAHVVHAGGVLLTRYLMVD